MTALSASAFRGGERQKMVGEWEQLDLLGKGGRGSVYRARTPKRLQERSLALTAITNNIPFGAIDHDEKRKSANLAPAVWTYARPEDSRDFGALKIFKKDPDKVKADQAQARFGNELSVLRENRQGLIRLLDSDEKAGWMVTEFMAGGTLEEHPSIFRGDAGRALKAFSSLVRTVASLHENEIVHRDIKPANVFIGDDGNLVLGDFGIVYLPDQVEHVTVTDERVGSRDYMPPWADLGERFNDVQPNFDVYMLGKLLWCMVSGRLKLPRENFRRDQYNLVIRFPDDPQMYEVNTLLEKCVVPEPEDCLSSAQQLLPLVENSLKRLGKGGQLLGKGIPRPCRICGEGFYQPHEQRNLSLRLWREGSDTLPVPVRPFICGSCHHIEFFNVGG